MRQCADRLVWHKKVPLATSSTSTQTPLNQAHRNVHNLTHCNMRPFSRSPSPTLSSKAYRLPLLPHRPSKQNTTEITAQLIHCRRSRRPASARCPRTLTPPQRFRLSFVGGRHKVPHRHHNGRGRQPAFPVRYSTYRKGDAPASPRFSWDAYGVITVKTAVEAIQRVTTAGDVVDTVPIIRACLMCLPRRVRENATRAIRLAALQLFFNVWNPVSFSAPLLFLFF
ncbi:hypothetical protein DFH11DRAFT_441018 [Phellopilus nigrolimitatus]|nr:hypothetical protein DFH11DRAFT_441018 [Phellopilus nigrolimitatus]